MVGDARTVVNGEHVQDGLPAVHVVSLSVFTVFGLRLRAVEA
jgi:hypothetical protein